MSKKLRILEKISTDSIRTTKLYMVQKNWICGFIPWKWHNIDISGYGEEYAIFDNEKEALTFFENYAISCGLMESKTKIEYKIIKEI